jgi:hypothetical protein
LAISSQSPSRLVHETLREKKRKPALLLLQRSEEPMVHTLETPEKKGEEIFQK